jgi:hypothetical protein
MTYNVFIPLSKTSFVLFPLILLGQVQEKNLAYDELYNLCSDNVIMTEPSKLNMPIPI